MRRKYLNSSIDYFFVNKLKGLTRSKSGDSTNKEDSIYKIADAMLERIETRPVRLAGICLSVFADTTVSQMSLTDISTDDHSEKLDAALFDLQRKYGRGVIKTEGELSAEKRVGADT